MTEQSKLAVTVDIEDWYHLPAISGAPFSPFESSIDFLKSWEEEFDYLTKPTIRTLEILDKIGVKATFFVVADVVNNYPGLVEKIADRGHEIGCHGLHHEYAIHPKTKEPLFSREEYHDKLSIAKSILEEASGQEITGFRAPNAYIGGWMIEMLKELGFKYDSSVARNSIYNKTDSKLDGVGTQPYSPATNSLQPTKKKDDFIELPWPYYKFSGFKLPAAGGPIIRLFGYNLVERGIKQSLTRDHTIFYFHPIDMARERFPEAGNIKKRPAFRIGRGKKAEKRIEQILINRSEERLTNCDRLYYETLEG